MNWSSDEVALVVADYLRMLTLELSGQSFSKAAHRRRLQQKLGSRTEASIEFKHQNISAVMIELGYPFIRGYQPRTHYQTSLASEVVAQVQRLPLLNDAALAAVDKPAVTPLQDDFSTVRAEAPAATVKASEPTAPFAFHAVKRDYLAREAHNRSLGLAGESFVVDFERWRLVQLGAERLAHKVEHVSQSLGDGLGYDVLSFDADGKERLIEVKTTSFGKETPFFVTEGELTRSRQDHEHFHLYRLFDFRNKPRLFSLQGALDRHCTLDPHTYRASFS